MSKVEDGMIARQEEEAEANRWRWPGLIGGARWILTGTARPAGSPYPRVSAAAPKSDMADSRSKTTSTIYANMNQDYKWFRKDRLVKRCIVTNAFFSTLSAGFETELQVVDKSIPESGQEAILKRFEDVKVFIDALNEKLHMDQVLFITQIKRSIFGKSGWEIVMDGADDEEGTYPDWLLTLDSTKLIAKQDKKTWELLGWKYGNKRQNPPKYKPDEVWNITNLQLENDYEGLSDIETIREVCNARNEVIWENFPEIVRTLWAAVHIASVDTSGMSDAAETSFLNSLGQKLRAGKALAVNKSIELTSIALKADIAGLSTIMKDLKEEIIGNFGTPRFLLGQPIENRATAYAEFEAYIEGAITAIQNELARVMETWYKRWVEVYLKNDAKNRMNFAIVELKHVWNTIRVNDVYAAAEAAAALWGMSGMGPLGIRQDYEKIGELMGWMDWPPKDEELEMPEELPEEEEEEDEPDRVEEAMAAGLNLILGKLDAKIDAALEEM